MDLSHCCSAFRNLSKVEFAKRLASEGVPSFMGYPELLWLFLKFSGLFAQPDHNL